MIRRLPLFFSLVLLSSLHAQVDPLANTDLSAVTTTADAKNNAVILSGQARLTDGDTLLEADEIRYLYDTNTAIATGHARLTRGEDRLLAKSIAYKRSDHTFTAEGVRLGRYPYYISADSSEGDGTVVTVHNAVVSIREPAFYQPTLKAESLTYVVGDKISAQHAQLGIGGALPFSISNFSHGLNIPLVSYLSLNAGYRSSLGVFGEAQLDIPIGDGLKIGGMLGAYSARGFMAGPSAKYHFGSGDLQTFGNFKSGFINDYGDKFTDLLGRPIPDNRGFAQWSHSQDLTSRLKLTAQLNYWRDSEILRDFRPDEFFPVQEPDNYIQAVYTGANYFITAFTRAQPNDFHRVQQRLPEVRFDLMPVALGNGFYERFQASVAALREEPLGNLGPTTRSDRFDAYYSVSKTITKEDWFSFTPIAGARVTHYQRATGGKSSYTRTLGEFGFDAELRTSSVSEYRNDIWKINGIRHLFTPKISYRYVPGADKGRAYIPPIDTLTFNTYLPPIGLADTRNIDELRPTNVLRFGFDNTWQTRDPEYGSRDLLAFNIAGDFRFSRTPGEHTLSDIHSVLAFTPAHWMQFDIYQRINPHDFSLQEFNTGLTLHDGNAWSVNFSSHFLHSDIEEFILRFDVRLNEAYELLAKLHYDTRRRRFNEQAYGVRQNLGNTWSLAYLVTLYDGPRRESNFGFNVSIEALGF